MTIEKELENDKETMSFNLHVKENDKNKVCLIFDFTSNEITYTVNGEEF